MKRIAVLLSTLFVLLLSTLNPAHAQSAGSMDTVVTITLKAKHHAYLVAFMGEKGSTERIKYLNQVAAQVQDTAQREADVTVSVTANLVLQLYQTVGSQPERLTTVYNEEIRQLLVPQIAGVPQLLAGIQAVAARNAAETERMVQFGFTFIHELNQ